MFGNQLVTIINYIFIPRFCFLSQWLKSKSRSRRPIVFHAPLRKELAKRNFYSHRYSNKPVILMTQKRIWRVSDTIWLRINVTAPDRYFVLISMLCLCKCAGECSHTDRFKVHTHRETTEAKVEIFFEWSLFFFDIFCLVFDLFFFCFRSHLRLVWIGPNTWRKNEFSCKYPKLARSTLFCCLNLKIRQTQFLLNKLLFKAAWQM